MTGRYAQGRHRPDPQVRTEARLLRERPVGRWSLAVLAGTAAAAETVLALTAGAAVATGGALLFAAVGLLTARYVAGAESEDGLSSRTQRMVEQRTAGLGDWRPAVEGALAGHPEDVALLRARLQRLYDSRLTERHGVSLHHEPRAAAALVGPGVWRLIDLDTEFDGPVPPALLRSAVDGLQTV
ncbi:hypothetical protein [Kitasatospora sp. NPDC004289]